MFGIHFILLHVAQNHLTYFEKSFTPHFYDSYESYDEVCKDDYIFDFDQDELLA